MSMSKGLSGGSSVNIMVWARGHRCDWDHFAAETGDAGWSLSPYRELAEPAGSEIPGHDRPGLGSAREGS
ncbi:GMC family oxidoreductase N-terminal domain-containing protein [Bosea sp. (in: a-proteobacteria)]|uniref:GMC family oxidoreductase N-terminal domain-containing protein n=1 Tax=Bosea sp. (in: a-proteobacteria) TaxID=1871050 RepID=UPI003524FFAE